MGGSGYREEAERDRGQKLLPLVLNHTAYV